MKWELKVTLLLVFSSSLVYLLNYFLFKDLAKLESDFFSKLAFTPLSIMFITFFVNLVMKSRDRKILMKKMNLVIGIFFSEMGDKFIRLINSHILDAPESNIILKKLQDIEHFSDSDWKNVKKDLEEVSFKVMANPEFFNELNSFFSETKPVLMRMIENPNLREHDAFSDLIWMIFHLDEEIEFRLDKNANYFKLANGTPHESNSREVNSHEKDLAHLEGDLIRIINALFLQWVTYLEHLKSEYPYLYSLKVRMNPFKSETNPIIGN